MNNVTIKIMLIVLVCLPWYTSAHQYNIPFSPQVAGTPITRFFTTNSSERYLAASSTYAVSILSTGFTTAPVATHPEGEFFDIIGADGTLSDLCLYNRGNALDSGEEIVATIMFCDGGDQNSCTWTEPASPIEVTFGFGDVWVCDNTNTLVVDAGDEVYMRVVTNSNPLAGNAEAIETYIEFAGTNSNEWFTSGGSVDLNGGPADSITVFGIDNFTQGTDNKHYAPFGDVHTLTGFFMDREVNPTSLTTYTVCLGDGGTDSACGSAGTDLMSCSIDTTGSQACTDTTCNAGDCDTADTEHVWVQASATNASFGIGTHTALRFENTSQRWQSGLCQAADLSNEVESGGPEGYRNGWYCNAANGESGCASRLDREATTVNMRLRTSASITGGSIDLSFREELADCSSSCTLSTGQSVSCATACTVDADNAYNWQVTHPHQQDSLICAYPHSGSHYELQ